LLEKTNDASQQRGHTSH